jgi:hypothetical protein
MKIFNNTSFLANLNSTGVLILIVIALAIGIIIILGWNLLFKKVEDIKWGKTGRLLIIISLILTLYVLFVYIKLYFDFPELFHVIN